jgi:hypothetical protein
MPFLRPAVIALVSALLTLIVIHGQEILKGWAGEGTVATARAWISPEGVLRPVDWGLHGTDPIGALGTSYWSSTQGTAEPAPQRFVAAQPPDG